MRPRRTSEFLDETSAPSVASARSARTTTHRLQTTPGTAHKYLQRATLGTRNSFDRGGSASRAAAAARGALITPVRLTTTRCALFATGTNGAVALHNDKKWVQEQTQRITEHLKRAALMGHTNVDFINQTTLRQMSIKHFVSTINYFLQFMAGNRLSVGSNHVEDIVSVLQKLQYPYAVNKSWLKTPNTQHSFGNVIVLFSYMLDFVPPPPAEDAEEWLFPLEESPDNLAERSLVSWDPDFQQQMMRHCAEAFSLWDKQLMDDYAYMQQQTCNLFIQKRSGLPNASALERAIEKFGNEVQALRPKCKPMSVEHIQKQQQLQEKQDKLNELKKKYMTKLESMQQEQQELNEDYNECVGETLTLQKEIEELKKQIQQQTCTVTQRNVYKNQLNELKLMFESEKRTMQTVRDQNYAQQIKLSRSKQQFTVKIEQFNARMRDINEIVQDCQLAKDKYLSAIANGDFQLALNVEPSQLQNVKELLETLEKHICEGLKILLRQFAEVNQQLELTQSKIKEMCIVYDFQQKELHMMRHELAQQQQDKLNKLKHINEYYLELKVEIEKEMLMLTQKNAEHTRTQQELKNLRMKHENKLKHTEEKHAECMSLLDEFHEQYEQKLNENFKELIDLHQTILKFAHDQ